MLLEQELQEEKKILSYKEQILLLTSFLYSMDNFWIMMSAILLQEQLIRRLKFINFQGSDIDFIFSNYNNVNQHFLVIFLLQF